MSRQWRSERGASTLLEVLLAAALFLVVGGAFLRSMESTTSSANSDQRALASREQVRIALDTLATDLRSTTTISAATPVADMPWLISVSAFDRAGAVVSLTTGRVSGALSWQRTSAPALTRVLASTINNPASDPVIRYYRSNGVELVPSVDGATNVANCTARLRITVSVASVSATSERASVDVPLPNRQALSC
jgi:type II secretory pathway pseudopilin PulG